MFAESCVVQIFKVLAVFCYVSENKFKTIENTPLKMVGYLKFGQNKNLALRMPNKL